MWIWFAISNPPSLNGDKFTVMFIDFQHFSITEILRINLAAIVIDQHLVSKFNSHKLIMEFFDWKHFKVKIWEEL